MTNCKFNSVHERDMDLVFAEAIATDREFALLVIKQIYENFSSDQNFEILNVELSHRDAYLGESDITVIVKINNQKIGLLIEDKIDAPAMPDQAKRYAERGEKGRKDGVYNEYFTLIVCPKKYYDSNEEAKKYKYSLQYENCEKHFAAKSDALSSVRQQLFHQAINKAKKKPETITNEAMKSYFRKYRNYQKNHFPCLKMRTDENSNGWWVEYATSIKPVYILHKIQDGQVQLVFPNAVKKPKHCNP